MPIAFRDVFSATSGSSSVSSFAVNVPSLVVNDDMMVMYLLLSNSNTVTGGLAGWSLVVDTPWTPITLHTSIYVKKAASEPASYTITFSGGVAPSVIISAYSGVDFTRTGVAAGVDKVTSVAKGGANNYAVASMTPTQTYEVFVSFIGGTGFSVPMNPYTPPPGFTERAFINRATSESIELSDKTFTSSAATGTQTTSFSATTFEGYAGGILLWPLTIPVAVVPKLRMVRAVQLRRRMQQKFYVHTVLRKPKGHITRKPPVRRPVLKLYADTRSLMRPKLPATKTHLEPPFGRISNKAVVTGVFATGVVGIPVISADYLVVYPPTNPLYKIKYPIGYVGTVSINTTGSSLATGVSGSAVVGTPTIGVSYGVTGVFGTARIGTVIARVDVAVPVTGVFATGYVGSPGFGLGVNVAGVSATAWLGSFSTRVDSAPTAAVAATAVLGTVTVRVDANVAVAGLSARAVLGLPVVTVSYSASVVGVVATGVVGTVTLATRYPIGGVFATGVVGIAHVGLGAEVLGVTARGIVGQPAIRVDCVVVVTGVTAVGVVGTTLSAYGETPSDTLNWIYTRAP